MKNGPNDPNERMDMEIQYDSVRGVSRRIVVVPVESDSVYEKVIYVVRDDAAKSGVTAQEVLREAQSLLRAEPYEIGEPLDPEEETQDTERVSRILFALSGVALALSGGVLVYWFFAWR